MRPFSWATYSNLPQVKHLASQIITQSEQQPVSLDGASLRVSDVSGIDDFDYLASYTLSFHLPGPGFP